MPTVSGQVIFDIDRTATPNPGDSGLPGVSVVLQNTATGVRLAVLTAGDGSYAFINVPAGSYRIVEAYGTTGALPTPGDFSAAAVGPVPDGVNPPITIAADPPAQATHLDSLSPDTLFVTVAAADVDDQIFLDGPVRYTPIVLSLDPCVTLSDINLAEAADGGSIGYFPAGSPLNTGAPIEPYPEVTPDFTYVLPDPEDYTPIDGEYTVQNTMTDALSEVIGAWWRIADHTRGNETGRMMVVNGYDPGAVFFQETVTVQPNTHYLFTSWILNLFKVAGYADPQLGVVILDQNDVPIYSATLGSEIPVSESVPEWKEIGTVIYSQNNTGLTVKFLSEGPAEIGNDYAIDDVTLREIAIPRMVPVKSADASEAEVGQTVAYTVTLQNTCQSPLTDVVFEDALPGGLVFVPGSVVIDGVPDADADPMVGFALPDLDGGEAVTVIFEAVVENVPNPNPARNGATISYSYTPVPGGISNRYASPSNLVPLDVADAADLTLTKTAQPTIACPGATVTYTLAVANLGPYEAHGVTLSDPMPVDVILPEFSLDGGLTWNAWRAAMCWAICSPKQPLRC